MNAAQAFGSAPAADHWTAIWIYFAASLAGMLAATEIYVRPRGAYRRAALRAPPRQRQATHLQLIDRAVAVGDGSSMTPYGVSHG
jgi:hypothetical protein